MNEMISVFDILPGTELSAKLPDMVAALPEWRRRKVLSYRFDSDRFQCAKAYLMLEEMLRSGYGIDKCPEFSYEAKGKPFFAELPGIHFNLSHCPRGIACAISDRPVGVDIEVIQFDSSVAETVLNAKERDQLDKCGSKSERFTELWTMKESFLKLTGHGMADDMKDILNRASGVDFHTTVNSKAGYVCTSAEFSR